MCFDVEYFDVQYAWDVESTAHVDSTGMTAAASARMKCGRLLGAEDVVTKSDLVGTPDLQGLERSIGGLWRLGR